MKPAIRRSGVLMLVVIAIAIMVPAAASATVNAYMKVEGLTGESTYANHTGWIDLLGFSASATAPGTSSSTSANAATASSSSDPSPAPQSCQVTVTKVLDIASPHLWALTATGAHSTGVEIDVIGPSTTTPSGLAVVYKIFLKDVQFTSVSTSSTSEVPTETLSLKATNVSWTFYPPTSTGQTPAPVTFSCT